MNASTHMSFSYCHLNIHANLLRPWSFPLSKLFIFFFNKSYYQELYILIIKYINVVNLAEWMEVLKVKINFKKPSSGSRHESPKISKTSFLSLK